MLTPNHIGLYSDESFVFTSSGGNLNISLNTYITTSYFEQTGWYGASFPGISSVLSHLKSRKTCYMSVLFGTLTYTHRLPKTRIS